MPKSVFYSQSIDTAFTPTTDTPPAAYDQIRLSIVDFQISEGEEIFLLYSKGFERGPGIKRTGDRSPSMPRAAVSALWSAPWEETTDPLEQRYGTWFLQEGCRTEETKELEARLKKIENELQTISDDNLKKRLKSNKEIIERFIDFAKKGPAYDSEFINYYSNYEIIGQQGCGDLTMNLWHVAFICSKFTGDQPKLIYLLEETVAEREYTALIKWKSGKKVTIEWGLRFNPYGPPYVKLQSKWLDEDIEFAVSAKPVIREGQLVDFAGVVHQFSDMRHLFQLPNLNPPEHLYTGDRGRPRYYYGRNWDDNVWFGEKQLIDDWNLKKAALRGPVVFDRLYGGMGASEDQVKGAMEMAGYKTPPSDPLSLREGEWQFVPWNKNLVEVYLKRSFYPWGMIGVTEDGKHILAFACNGHQGRSGYTLEQACQIFIDETKKVGSPVWHALLMDEGNDVFQKAKLGNSLEEIIPLRRRQLRASFIFAQT